jgi:5-methyltetrahydrofolate--homocysteine methyltransferase
MILFFGVSRIDFGQRSANSRTARIALCNRMTVMLDLKPLYDAVLTGEDQTARTTAANALQEGVEPITLVNQYMVPAMDEVGRRFECQEYFLPEMFLSVRAMKAAMELIRPLLSAKGTEPAGRVVIGTVRGDQHDIGKNLVAALLEGGGFAVTDLGVNVSPELFVNAVKDANADLVALSALLTTTMPAMKDTVEALKQAGVRDRVKVLIGGAPVTQRYADEIGADGYGESAPAAVFLAKAQMAKAQPPAPPPQPPPAPAPAAEAPAPLPLAQKPVKGPKAVRKAVAKKPALKKAPAKKAPAPSPRVRKPVKKAAPAKKAVARKPALKKAPAKKAPAPSPRVRKPAKKAAPAKKAMARKPALRKAPAKKRPAKKAAPQRPVIKKRAAKK